jgi:hypothetical protein
MGLRVPLRFVYETLTPVWAISIQTGVMLNSIGSYAIHIASVVFLVGLAGSSIVVLISFFEDFLELFSKNDESEVARPQPPAA